MSARYIWSRWAADPHEWRMHRGAPGIAFLGNAIESWARERRQLASVTAMAEHLSVDPERIAEAVKAHPRLRLIGPRAELAAARIECEGVEPRADGLLAPA